MVDGDAVKPGAPGGFAAEFLQVAVCLEENIVGGVLGFLVVAEHSQGQVIHGAAVLSIKICKIGGSQPGLRRLRTLLLRLRRRPGWLPPILQIFILSTAAPCITWPCQCSATTD